MTQCDLHSTLYILEEVQLVMHSPMMSEELARCTANEAYDCTFSQQQLLYAESMLCHRTKVNHDGEQSL